MSTDTRTNEQLLSAAGNGEDALAVLVERHRERLERTVRLRMDPHDREVLILRHFEELSHSEAAHVLAIKASAETVARGRTVHPRVPGDPREGGTG